MIYLLVIFLQIGVLNAFDVIPSTVIAPLLEEYNQDEIERINRDARVIYDSSTYKKEGEQCGEDLVYIATAGAPGSAKSTILETFLEKELIDGNFVYVDPDRVTMRSMVYTYVPYLSLDKMVLDSYIQVVAKAYNKWRAASNYITNNIINYLVSEKYSIIHGTTSTSRYIGNFYDNLKANGYTITLLLCGASDSAREEMIRHRVENQKVYQSTEADALTKAELFPQRFSTYFEKADTIYIYWTSSMAEGSILAASYTDKEGYEIMNREALDAFVSTHGALPYL